MENRSDKLILITNDDGIEAKGLQALIEAARDFGELLVVAPKQAQSGMSHAITIKVPLRLKLIRSEDRLKVYDCNGTPVDCVKLALNTLVPRRPDLILSGINHGSNSASSVVYSGTMGAAIEGCLNGFPSAGFSLLDFAPDADFSGTLPIIRNILQNMIQHGLPKLTCLNVNIPVNHIQEIKGVKICRQNKGFWKEEFEKRVDPNNHEYYWLTGEYFNLEPEAQDTDEWALKNNYVSVVPVKVDLTDYDSLERIRNWNFNH